MIPFAHLSNQLSSSNYPSTLVYNTGNVNLDPNSSRNVAIYNAPGGTVNILSSGSYSCHTCGERFNSQAAKEYHDMVEPYGCSQHKVCFDDWDAHIRNVYHTQCPKPGCPKKGVDFGSDARFMQHWRNKH